METSRVENVSYGFANFYVKMFHRSFLANILHNLNVFCRHFLPLYWQYYPVPYSKIRTTMNHQNVDIPVRANISTNRFLDTSRDNGMSIYRVHPLTKQSKDLSFWARKLISIVAKKWCHYTLPNTSLRL